MYLEPIGDLASAQLAEYERVVSRVLLEAEAEATARTPRATSRQPRHLHFPWVNGRRHQGSPA